MIAYYNENDPQRAAWLRELIRRGEIANGVVDERSIAVVRPGDVAGYGQCHWFAGVGVWSYALRLAGWDDGRPAWTGSCPCQPFSLSGLRAGARDPRHLWPVWRRLVAERRPGVVFGEQVSGEGGLAWLDDVQADLEGENYAFAAFDLCAAGFGAPHIRQRLYWVADAAGPQFAGDSGGVLPLQSWRKALRHSQRAAGTVHDRPDLEGGDRPWRVNGHWAGADWIVCGDGNWRPVEPGVSPLVDGTPSGVVRMRGYGDAIVAQQAAEFIRAYMEVVDP